MPVIQVDTGSAESGSLAVLCHLPRRKEAPTIAADPAAGAVEVGRDLHGRPVAVVLHAPTWSLVIHRTGNPNQPVTSRAYLDGYSTDAPPDFCFDADCTVTGVEWSNMIAAVLAAVT